MIIEAMKMENNIAIKRDAVIKSILVKQDEMVEAGVPLIEIE
jgi:biotin carboxyl carrier protein